MTSAFPRAERFGTLVDPMRGYLFLCMVPANANLVVMELTGLQFEAPAETLYLVLSSVLFWLAFALVSVGFWFAPRAGNDTRPLYRRGFNAPSSAVLPFCAFFSTATCLWRAGVTTYLYGVHVLSLLLTR